MSAWERISKADWSAWLLHLWAAAVSGLAEGIETCYLTGGAAVMSSAQWTPMAADYKIMVWAGAGRMVISVARYLKSNPVPNGSEVDDKPSTQ